MLLQHDVSLLDCCLQVCRGARLALQAVRCRRPTLWRSPTPRSSLQVCRQHLAEHWMLCAPLLYAVHNVAVLACVPCRIIISCAGIRRTAGKSEGTLEERWADLGNAAGLIAAAPDDEILGEILALQVGSCTVASCTASLHGQACHPGTLLPASSLRPSRLEGYEIQRPFTPCNACRRSWRRSCCPTARRLCRSYPRCWRTCRRSGRRRPTATPAPPACGTTTW
jgi:hypothetical protein